MLRLHKNIGIINLGLYLPKTLVISDLHIGYEEMMASRGTLVPRFQLADMIKQLDDIIQSVSIKTTVKTIVINGDLKHEFGSILRTEWREILKFIDYIAQKTENIIITKGNHDSVLEPITRKRNIHIVKNVKIGDILIVHGDTIDKEALQPSVKTIIIGHEHPAIGLKDKSRYEKYKCFLKGRWKGKTLIVQPSFNPLTEGTDILREPLLSPYLKNVNNFEVFVVSKKEVLPFGKVKSLR